MINTHDVPNTNIKPVNTISELKLEKINKFTTTTFTREQLFTFEMLLIDDTVTRNFTLYPESFQRKMLKKPIGGGNWIGLPMLMGAHEDHETKASNQVGRIYDAKLVKTPKGHIGTIASVYVPVNEANKALIDNIKAGVHKEVSIGVSVEEPTCSVCGKDIRECNHEPGVSYNESLCHIIMNGDVEGQEVSFVAVPGNLNAKILTDNNDYVPLTEALGKFRKSIRKENKKMAKRNKRLASKESLNLLALAKFVENGSVPDPTTGEARRFANSLDDEDEDDNDKYTEEDDEDDDKCTESEDEDDEEDKDEYEEEDDEDDEEYSESDEDDEDEYEDEDDEDEYEEEDDEDEDKQEENLLGLGAAALLGGHIASKSKESLEQQKVYKAIEKSLRNIYKSQEKLQRQAKDGRAYKEKVLKETVRLGALAGIIPVQAKETFRKTYSKLSTKELLAIQKGYKKQAERLYPPTGKARAVSGGASNKAQHKERMSVTDILKEFNK